MRTSPRLFAILLGVAALAPRPVAANTSLAGLMAFVRENGGDCRIDGKDARCACALMGESGPTHRIAVFSEESVALMREGDVFWSNPAGEFLGSNVGGPRARPMFGTEAGWDVAALENHKIGPCP